LCDRINTIHERGGRFEAAGGDDFAASRVGTIELGDSTLAGAIPYIDFHYGIGTDQDYKR
jgi:hypothetical protein